MKDDWLNQMLLAGLILCAAGIAGAATEQDLIAVLRSNAGVVEKCAACQQLRLCGTAQSVASLAALLADERVGHAARYALEGMPYAEASAALREAIGRTAGAIKAGLIDSAGRRGDTAATPLIAPLLSDTDTAVAAAAASALGGIGDEAATAALVAACDSRNPEIRNLVLESLLRCAERRLRQGDELGAASLYEKMLNSSQPSYIQAAALRGLAATVPPAQAAALLVKGLSSPDSHLQQVAARCAQEVGGPEVTRALAAALPKLPPPAQVLLIQALGVRGDGAGLSAVTATYNSPDTNVRTAALEAVGAIGDASCVRMLAEWAGRGNEQERAAGAKSLLVLRGTDIDAELIRQLSEVLPQVRVEVIKALAARNVTASVLALFNEAAGHEAAVRTVAIRALRELAGADHLAALVDLLLVLGAPDADEIRQTIVAVARRHSAEEQAARHVVARYQGLPDNERRGFLLATLGDLGHGGGLPVLREALKDEDTRIRRAALVALGAWPTAEPADDLLEVARRSPNEAHRVLALRGYVDLVKRAAALGPAEKLGCYRTALGLAPNAGEKKRVLAALPTVKTLEALQLAASQLPDEAVRQEAALAVAIIAREVYPGHAGPVKAALEKVVAAEVTEDIKRQARQTLDEIETVRSYLLDWEVAGPYLEKGKNHAELFDIPFGPERPNAEVAWRKMPVSTSGERIGYLDLLQELNGGEQRVAYLRTQIESAENKIVTLEIFSDDGVKAWLNGKVVHANNVARPIPAEPDRVTATLQKGANRLLLKVTQNNLPWGAIVRVRDAEIFPVRGAKPVEPKVGEGFKLHVLNADSRYEAAGVLDVNRDGKLDILSGGFWYEAPNWEKHFVREIKEEGNYFYDFANLPMDVDGDGWTDTVGAAWHNRMVYWVRNPGKSDEPWQVFEIDTPGNMETALAVDIDGDGQLDILPNIMTQAAWYEFHREASAPGKVRWEKHALPQEAAGHGVGAGDVNGDGRCDVIAPRGWAEQTAAGWQWHQEFELGSASIPVLVQDVDADGDSDILYGLGHNYGLFWLEQARSGDGRTWTKHLIDDSWSQPHFMLLADLDNDGKHELLTGKRYYAHNGNDPGENDPRCVYSYDFDAATKKWTRHVVHEGGAVGFGINTAVADIDGDGDLDVVAPGKSGLYLLENLIK